ncbi:MAG: hypothetical protein IJ512_05650 [Ruminococcus sp.]|nr:hypothetical protein [Ruminococcus sp.]
MLWKQIQTITAISESSIVIHVQQEMEQIRLENGGIPEDMMRTERVTDERTE